MNEISLAPLLMLNTSFPNQTSLPDDDEEMTFASAYVQHDVTWVLWLVVPPVLLVLGCYGNVMTILVMRTKWASESTGSLCVYFTALAVSDLLVLCTNVVWFWPQMVLDSTLVYLHDLSCMVTFFISDASSMTSAWFLVAMTCQRMTSVVLPHRVEVLCTPRKGKVIICTVFIISCMVNLHCFFFLHIEYVEQGYPSCVSSDKNFANTFAFLYLCVVSVIPFVCLIVANSILIWGAVKSMKMSGKMAWGRQAHTSSQTARLSSMTTTLILVSVAYLLLTLPTSVMWVYFEIVGYFEGDIQDDAVSQQLALVDTVCILLWLSNSSINFYIYILSGRKFRKEAKRYLLPCLRSLRGSKTEVSE